MSEVLMTAIAVAFAALAAFCFHRSTGTRGAGLAHARSGTVVGEPGAIAVGLRRTYEKRGDPEPYWALVTLEVIGGPFWIRTREGKLVLASVEGADSLALDVPEGQDTPDPTSSRRRYCDRASSPLVTTSVCTLHGSAPRSRPATTAARARRRYRPPPGRAILVESAPHRWRRRARRMVWVLAGVSAAAGAPQRISAWLLAQLLLTAVLIAVANYLPRDTQAGRRAA